MIRRLSVILFLLFIAHSAQTVDTVAWIKQCSGAWEDHTDPNNSVKIVCKGLGQELWLPLSLQSKIILTSHKPHEWINVQIASSGEKLHFDCDKPNQCAPPPLPFFDKVPKAESTGLLQMFFKSPERAYARVQLLLSKSQNNDAERVTADHAVVAEDETITLDTLIRRTAPSGEYLLELCPFDEKNGCPLRGTPHAMKWAPTLSATPWPTPVKVGLYEIVLDKVQSGETMRTTDRGLLLVTPKQNAATVRETVAAGEQVFLKDWKDQGKGRLMFQALLVELASRSQ